MERPTSLTRTLIRPPRLPMAQTHALPASTSANVRVELLNIQSLLLELPDIRTDVHQRRRDIQCYVETNLKSSTPNRLLAIEGYRLFRRDRITGRKKSGRGAAIYVREDLQVEKIKITSSFGTLSHAEILWLKVKIDRKKAMIIACIYRLPSTSHSQTQAGRL